jgi:cytochrome c5
MNKKKFPQAFAAVSLMTLVSTLAIAMGSHPQDMDEEALNARIQPMAKVTLAAASAAGAVAGNRSGEEIYKGVCMACHATGAAGAPKTGDKAAWAPRIALGLDGLTKSAIAGKNAMPPKGGSNATDEELARAIAFMTNQSGASFKEPPVAAK